MSTPATERARELLAQELSAQRASAQELSARNPIGTRPPPPPRADQMTRPTPPPGAGPRPARAARPLPPWSWALVIAIAAVAVLADQAVRVPLASVAGTLLVVATAGLLTAVGRTRSLAQRGGLGLLVAAGVVFTLRDSPWVTISTLLSVCALVALIAGDGIELGQRRPWVRIVSAGIDALVDVVPWFRSGAALLDTTVSSRAIVWLRAAGISLLVAFALGGLLASGDAAFGWLVSIFDVLSWVGHLLLISILVLPAALLALVAVRAEPEPLSAGESAAGERSNRVEALAALWATAVTLLVWCGMQVVLMSGGARSVVLSEQGMTAAEYARQGFFQLVAVAALSLAVVNVAHRTGRRHLTPDRDQRIPVVLVGLALGVLIVVSFSRLGYYIGSFGLTMLRLSVATFLAWLAMMTGASVARSLGLHHDRNWLPTASVVSAVVFALVFGVANPERWVAQVNLDRATIDDPVDVRYLMTELGSDAAPTIAEYRWARLGGRPDVVDEVLCTNAEARAGWSPLGWNRSRSYQPDHACPEPALPAEEADEPVDQGGDLDGE